VAPELDGVKPRLQITQRRSM